MHNTNGEVILLVKLQDTACNFTKSHTLPWVFFTFFKFYKWYQIAQSVSKYIDSRQNTYQRLVSCIFLWNSKKPSTKCLNTSQKKKSQNICPMYYVFIQGLLNYYMCRRWIIWNLSCFSWYWSEADVELIADCNYHGPFIWRCVSVYVGE